MKYCPQCGTENRPNARFCTNCSCSLLTERRCHQCGAANNLQANFCHQCAAHLKTAPFQKREGATGRLPPKSLLADRYMILKVIGRGGMGAVYLADDTRLRGKQWAIKEMSDSLLTDVEQRAQAIEAFQREAMLLSNLTHPNLPNVVDYFDENEKHYLVMDYVDGKTLADVATEKEYPVEETDVLDWAEQLCDVLHYLHTRPEPIIFRDLKPDNIMLTRDKQIKLIDFGIVRFFKQGKSSDTASFGTAGFAPPEQYGSGQTDARSDIYALGATLHYLLTLRQPHEDPFNFPPITKFNPLVMDNTEDVILKAVSRQRSDRWRTVAAMRSALIYSDSAPSSGSFAPSSGPFSSPSFPVSQNQPLNYDPFAESASNRPPHADPFASPSKPDPFAQSYPPVQQQGQYRQPDRFSGPSAPISSYNTKELPPNARGLCWGGFFIAGLWGFGNGMWYLFFVSLLVSVFFPILNLVIGLVLLFKGREWSWQNARWENVEQFNRAQSNWAIAGFILFGLLIFLIVAGL